MVKQRSFAKLSIPPGICVLAFCLASCSGSNGDNVPALETEPPNVYAVTVTAIEVEDKDTGLPIEVGGESINGTVYIEPPR
jgi:hypothetical protein